LIKAVNHAVTLTLRAARSPFAGKPELNSRDDLTLAYAELAATGSVTLPFAEPRRMSEHVAAGVELAQPDEVADSARAWIALGP
jgi:hypothetical protein